jgi:beta-glucosidase
MDSIIEERALREIYLAGFQRAIAKSRPWTVMSSYNRLNGVQTSQDPFLLTQVLRDEWGYEGLVMSDWYGIKDRPASLMAGNDLAMPETRRDKQTLLAAIEAGEVPMAVVDRACLRMLELLDKVQRHRRPQTRADFTAHHALAQRLAGESIVLLKNEDNLLPLRPEKTPRVAVLGKPAQEPVIQGPDARPRCRICSIGRWMKFSTSPATTSASPGPWARRTICAAMNRRWRRPAASRRRPTWR